MPNNATKAIAEFWAHRYYSGVTGCEIMTATFDDGIERWQANISGPEGPWYGSASTRSEACANAISQYKRHIDDQK